MLTCKAPALSDSSDHKQSYDNEHNEGSDYNSDNCNNTKSGGYFLEEKENIIIALK